MKRTLIVVLLIGSLLVIGADAKTKKKSAAKPPPAPCPTTMEDCLPEGCSPDDHHDHELNKVKNVVSSNEPIEDRTLDEIMALENKTITAGYQKGKPRKILAKLGEGTQVRTVGYLLAVKQEGGESCNCGLSDTDVTTDNHLVFVNPDVIESIKLPPHASKKVLTAKFHEREKQSVTAEFTPRVRADGHPNFTSELQKQINKTPQGALWVRITGQLMMDSQHFRQKTPIRATSWEVHPIFKLEYCPMDKKCPTTGKKDWVDLDE